MDLIVRAEEKRIIVNDGFGNFQGSRTFESLGTSGISSHSRNTQCG